MQIRKRLKVWLLIARVGQVWLAIPILLPWVAMGCQPCLIAGLPALLSAIAEVVMTSPRHFAIAFLVEHAAWAVLGTESPFFSWFFTNTICSAFVL